MTGRSQRAFVPTSALAKSVNFDEEMMPVSLMDGVPRERANNAVSFVAPSHA